MQYKCYYWLYISNMYIKTKFKKKRCSGRLYLQLFVGGLMSYLPYLCLLAHSGVQHILCCALVLFVFVSVASFSVLFIFDRPLDIL